MIQADLHQTFTTAFRDGGSWHGLGGTTQGVASWTGRADAVDRAMLAYCAGSTLDIGCGPGRMAELLASHGQVVLGIDVVPEAVFQTRERGAAALIRDIFDRIPAEGRWQTALLADGNIGIGGDPVKLLGRVRDVLAGGGRVVAELAGPGLGLQVGTVRLEAGGHLSAPFPWAAVGVDMAGHVADASGLLPPAIHRFGNRWLGVMEVPAR
ncbi:MAG: methyltransferase domain-containing protein [Nocardioides sp.]